MKKLLCALAIVAMCVPICRAADPNVSGMTLWGGASESGTQDGRIGWLFKSLNVEPAIGIRHKDAPPAGEEEWPIRGYLFFHALDAEFIAQAFKLEGQLPGGTIYAGPLAEYWHDRDKEFAGGVSVGGLVDLSDISPGMSGWYFYVENEWLIWNVDEKTTSIGMGLCKRF